MLLLKPEITLFISLLPAALSLSLPLSLPHIHFGLSILCLLSYVFLFHHVLLSLFNSLLLLGSTGVREGLKHQGKRGDIAFWHASYYFPFNFTAWRGMCNPPTPHPPVSPLLTLSPYLAVIMCCRWRRHCWLNRLHYTFKFPHFPFTHWLFSVQQTWATVEQRGGGQGGSGLRKRRQRETIH